MEEINIEIVTIDQIDLLREISLVTFRDTYECKNDPRNFEMHLAKAFSRSQLEEELNSQNCLFYFIKRNDRILGYIKLNIGEAQTEPMDYTYIELERIYILPEHKGQGLGRKLIDFAIQIGKELEFHKLWLGVWDQNPDAIKFYEKMGFVRTGTHIFTMGNDDQTDYVMKLNIP